MPIFGDEGKLIIPDTCALACVDFPLCGWWSHDSEAKNCILTLDCPFVNRECLTCVSGKRNCRKQVLVQESM